MEFSHSIPIDVLVEAPLGALYVMVHGRLHEFSLLWLDDGLYHKSLSHHGHVYLLLLLHLWMKMLLHHSHCHGYCTKVSALLALLLLLVTWMAWYAG